MTCIDREFRLVNQLIIQKVFIYIFSEIKIEFVKLTYLQCGGDGGSAA